MKAHSPSNMDIDFAWGSVKGPGHIQQGLQNQDACRVFDFSEGHVLVLSDGVGSKKNAHIGSQAIVRAVYDAVKKWSCFPDASCIQLIRLIHQYWNLYILPHEADDCAATCQFVAVLHSGRCVMGQIGDGLVLFQNGKQNYALHEKEDLYANTTTPISSVRSLNEWAMQDFFVADDFTVFLSSDGVSEDVNEEKRFEFLEYLLGKIKPLKEQRLKNQVVKRLMINWDNPYNLDDKSLIVFRRRVKASYEKCNVGD